MVLGLERGETHVRRRRVGIVGFVVAAVRCRPGTREVERGVLLGDRALERPQLGPGLDPELVAEHRPGALVGAQRVGLPAARGTARA